jgi:hypothetical protein
LDKQCDWVSADDNDEVLNHGDKTSDSKAVPKQLTLHEKLTVAQLVKEIPAFMEPAICYRGHINSPLGQIPSQLNPIHILAPYLFLY